MLLYLFPQNMYLGIDHSVGVFDGHRERNGW